MADHGSVAVIGSGGIGGYVAAALAEAGRTVTMCVRTPFETLTVEDKYGTRTVPMRVEIASTDRQVAGHPGRGALARGPRRP